jgi:peptide chain release factor 1
MIEARLRETRHRYEELQKELADPEIVRDQRRYPELMQELSALQELVDADELYTRIEEELSGARELVSDAADAEMRELAREELHDLEARKEELVERIKMLLVPKDPLDAKNIIMEVRAGTGGDEATLFAADLFRMYSRYAENQGWKIEILSSSSTEVGGFKEVIYSIAGSSVYADMRYESGTHRVQRVPVTEASGRIHTSAVTVAVLPEAEETDVAIRTEDLRVDVFRSSGPGGQSVNTTDSAVRITHLPTGLVVTCQDEKSQHKNKAKALRVLRARLYEAEENKRRAERAEQRRSQIGTGDRSQRIRTYNYPQNRLTDHRINLTLYKLDSIVEGNMEELVEALKLNAKEQLLKTVES